ncbi:MAG: PAS domain S-box protein [Candidatus Omnitrophota bacterium]
MKRCPKCSVEFSDMWNVCDVCKSLLTKDVSAKKAEIDSLEDKAYLCKPIEDIVDQAATLFLYLNKDLKLLMCNKALEAITGYSREEIFKDDWLRLLFKDYSSRREIFKAVAASCLSSIKSRTYQGAVTKKDGSECVLSWRNTAVVDGAGEVLGIICTAQDITDSKHSEDNLAAQSERLRNIFTSIRDYALITTNLDDKITYYGRSSAGLFGWSEDATLMDISILFPEDDRDSAKVRIRQSIDEIGRFEEEVELLSSGDRLFPAMLTANALLDKENNRAGYVYIARDITQRKKLESQIIQSEKLAAIGQLAAGVAHEMNNPLLVILGRLDMLSMEDEKISPEIKHTVEIIKTQSIRMRDIVDRLLTYSRPKASHMIYLDIQEILKTVAPLVAYHPVFKKIAWKEELPQDLPKVKGDFTQLQELFFNIAINACQATPEGGKVTVSTKDTKDGFIEIVVRDTGKGIKKEDLNKLFTPFFTTRDNGTGLGLAICQNIVNAHGGKIEVESEFGRGSIFKIRLPAKK